MRQFVYVSTAIALPETQVEAILASSQRNNGASGITGFLLYNGRNFLQMIEGQQADLIALMRRLAGDPRHNGMVRLHDEVVARRDCPEWAMQRLHLAQDEAGRRATIAGLIPQELNPIVRAMVLNFARLN